MNLPTLGQQATLIYISISVWSARKLDKKSSSKVTTEAGASADAARVNKYLLTQADDSLKKIQKLGGEARRYLEENSLPWDDAGNRLVSNEKAMEVITHLSVVEQEFRKGVDEFVEAYPVLRAQALSSLGDLGDNNDYPNPDEVRHKFAVTISMNPIPDGFSDVRTGLTAEQAAGLQAHYEANVQKQMNRALLQAWERLHDNVSHIADRLTATEDGKSKIFRNTMIENARETCSLLRSLNVFNDADLERMRAEVYDKLCRYEADDLRDNELLARQVRNDATDILARFKDILGE